MAKNGKGKTAAPAITAEMLLAKIDAIGAENKSLRASNMALMSQAPVVTQVSAPPAAVNLDGLPDPVQSPKEYAAEIAKRVSAHTNAVVNHATSTQTTAQTNKQRIDNLFNDFSSQFPELAKNRDRLEFIAQKVVNKAKESGINAEKYMFQAKDQFFADINDEYGKVFTAVAPAKAADVVAEPLIDNADPVATAEQTGGIGAALEEDEDDTDDGRSQGIFGGAESGNRQSAPGRSKEEDAARAKQGIKSGDLIDDLQKMQQKSGFF